MLTVKNSINLDFLFKTLIEDIKNIWRNPFDAPLVIFSDIKVEQWFKLSWIKDAGKDSILMNLGTARLEDFVFEAVANGISCDSKIWYERLDASILKAGIVRKLISESDGNGRKYYETLGSDSVKSFIENEDGTLNEIHLNNLAGKMANLFGEYLSTRNRNFESGILAKWNSGEPFFIFDKDEAESENLAIENWQKKLFKDVLNGEYFSIPATEKDKYTKKYVTLSELVAINKKVNGGSVNIKLKAKNIFLFGFSGMGQEYRELLKSMFSDSDACNLNVYIQSSERELSKTSNVLVKKWNRSGYENLSLWKNSKINSERNLHEDEKYKGTTLLKILQSQIQNDEANEKEFSSKLKDGSFTVCCSPSKLKEIESIHSSICSVISRKKQNGETVSYSDFVVLAPDIQEYKVPIKQVFEQTENYNENGFPYIPYVMADYTADSSAIAEALGVFVSMLGKKSLFRTDLFKLLRNAAVREARNFNDDEIKMWSSWVTELNGFRDRASRKNEWEKICRRLMLARLTDNPVDVSGGEDVYIPYSNLETENSDSLYKFIDAVESLRNFISVYSEKTELEEFDLDIIWEFFETWLNLPKECPKELKGEPIVYRELRKELHNQKLMFSFGCEKINAKCFFIALCDSAKASKDSSTNLFSAGVTFGNFALNRTIPAKYVYIVGLGSTVFPGTDSEQTLDLRSKTASEEGDENIVSRNKEAFLCQLMAAGEELHLSYVNKNLKKDEDFFRSSVIEDLYDFIKSPNQKISDFTDIFESRISIDEKRGWNELYTQREFRNKRNFLRLTDEQDEEKKSETKAVPVLPERVSISKMKNFLENPFVYQMKQVFDDSDGEWTEEEATLYEPVEISNLKKSVLVKEIVLKYFESDQKTVPDVFVKSEFEKLDNESAVPDGIFGELSGKDICGTVTGIIESLLQLKYEIEIDFGVAENSQYFKFNETKNISITQSIYDQNKTWMLYGTLSGYLWVKNEAGSRLEIAEIVASKDIKSKHLLNPYLTALLLVASREDDELVSVDIHLLSKFTKKTYSICAGQSINKSYALGVLQCIYSQMFVDKFSDNISIELFMKHKSQDPDYGFEKYKSAMLGELKYFSKKNLFNPYTDFGITPENFRTEFEHANEIMERMVKITQ
ncbi:exodeoxyribonuclease V subunit gamma [Treponema sp.]|uniref:exodeoxyribonuclease V subunit gamma n=1 Tax=Treponema sp. TaxID=166 RepID=UPI00298EB629|nr:exodeoxyribonuclease V subunit gamma [Treponema sp.]MCQ2240070.1 exodeoxyribonuclease V subunit gamma [Treponema sp.]